MGRILRCSLAGLAAVAFGALAQADANLRNLLTGLTQGTQITLLTPVGNGLVEVTSFRPAAPVGAVQAAAAVERARQALAALGVAQPTGQPQVAPPAGVGATTPR